PGSFERDHVGAFRSWRPVLAACYRRLVVLAACCRLRVSKEHGERKSKARPWCGPIVVAGCGRKGTDTRPRDRKPGRPGAGRERSRAVNGAAGGLVYAGRMSDSLERLYRQVVAAQDADPAVSRTARLMRSGRSKMAKKLAEEAIEVVIDAMGGKREPVVRESADLLYNLVVLWVEAGVSPQDVWDEMARRERLFGLAEKLPKRLRPEEFDPPECPVRVQEPVRVPEPVRPADQGRRRKVVALAGRQPAKGR